MSILAKFFLILAALLMILSGCAEKKDVIGYYPSWKWAANPQQYNPENIPYPKLTAVTYAFFYPTESGKIVGMDPIADRFLLKGEKLNPDGNVSAVPSMISLAHQAGIQVFLSIGGWNHSGNFPAVSADPQKRAYFAHWCIRHIREYQFDGIDIDWEFPGYVRHNGTPDDKTNFTLLLQTVRDSLNAHSAKTGKSYPLSASLPAAASHLTDLEVDKISAIVDRMNIMTYDLFGTWGQISNHNSALYPPAQGDPGRSLDGAFRLYHEVNQVPAEKITLTASFFGHAYANCTEIYGSHDGADTTLFTSGDAGSYADIAKHLDLFQRKWDEQAQAPYLVSPQRNILVSYDDEEAVKLKAEYVIKHHAAGLTIWQLMGDNLGEGRTPLLDAIDKTFNRN